MHVTDLYFLGARNHPTRLALTGDGGDFTYLEVSQLTNRIARRLGAAGWGRCRAPSREAEGESPTYRPRGFPLPPLALRAAVPLPHPASPDGGGNNLRVSA